MNRAANRGFTLIELLVALFIFAILAVMAYASLQSVLNARDLIEKKMDRLAEVQMFFSILGRDIEQAINRQIRDNYGEHQSSMVGDSSVLEFTRTGWRNPAGFARSHLQRIGYRLEDEQLMRFSWRVLDRAQDSEATDSLMLEGVDEFELRYMDKDLKWQSQWPSSSDSLDEDTIPVLPLAVEVAVDTQEWGRITRLFRIAGSVQ